MIAMLRMIRWSALYNAVKWACGLFGLAGLVAWFAAERPWWAVGASAIAVLAVVWCLYHIFCGIEIRRARRDLRRIDRSLDRAKSRRGYFAKSPAGATSVDELLASNQLSAAARARIASLQN